MTGWRRMEAGDIAAVAAISDAVHGRYTERPEIYAERLHLYPAGCFLFDAGQGAHGYLIGHPWRGVQPPALDRLVGALPAAADCFYLHDLALMPAARGTGTAQAGVQLMLEMARAAGLPRILLTAVNGADAFWRRQGFAPLSGAAPYGEGSLIMACPVRL